MDLKALVQQLNPVCLRALEQAAERSRAQGNWFVEPERLLLALLDDEHSDLPCYLRSAAISADALREEIRRAQAQFKTGCTRMPVFSVQLVELLEGAILLAVFQGSSQVRSALLLLTLLTRERLRAQLAQGMPSLLRLSVDTLENQWRNWCRHSVEEHHDTTPGVGKTAVAEGLVRRIAEGSVPPSLRNVALLDEIEKAHPDGLEAFYNKG